MALNPEISLGIRPVQAPDPLKSVGEALQLRNLMQRGQLQQEQLQGEQLENDKRKRFFEGQKTLGALVAQHTQPGQSGPDGTPGEPVRNHGAIMQGLNAAGFPDLAGTFDTERRANEKEANAAATARLKQAEEKLQLGANALTAVTLAPDPEKAATYQRARAALIESKAYMPTEIPEQYDSTWVAAQRASGIEATKQTEEMRATLKLHAELNEIGIKTGKAADKEVIEKAAAAGSQTQLDLVREHFTAQGYPKASLALIPAMYSPAAQEQLQQFALTQNERQTLAGQAESRAQTAKRDANTEKHNQNTEQHLKVGKSQRWAEINIQRQKFDADEGAMTRTAQALASGDLTRLRDIASLRGDQRLKLFDLAKQINPGFSTAEVDRKIKMEDYYANGKGADNNQSFGTFLQHAGGASDAVNNIRLTSSKAINRPINWWRDNMSGSPEYTALVSSLEPVRKEWQTFLLNGHALQQTDRAAGERIMSDNSSPAQIQAALKVLGQTAKDRFDEGNFRYKKVIGHDLVDPFSPEAIEGAKKIGVTFGQPKAQPAQSPAASAPKNPFRE